MTTTTHLGDDLQTTCLHCGSVFHITQSQLEVARGQARCSQCGQVFNALFTLENFNGRADNMHSPAGGSINQAQFAIDDRPESTEKPIPQTVTLDEAMFGDGSRTSPRHFKPVLWIAGIILLTIVTLIQVIYYQRYNLVASSQYQQQILNLCRILPCDASRFTSLDQIKLVERNVFTHPTEDKALMINGSFVNRAPFAQAMPNLLISLSDLQGNLIANRLFTPDEYLVDKGIDHIESGRSVQFRLEIYDPGTQALTYEFEFVS